MELVLIESPWKAISASEQVRNSQYARMCLTDCISRGEAPFASHLLYTQVLNEEIAEQRMTGIEIGLLWGKLANKTVVYQDFGITSGMSFGIKRALTEGRPVEYRNIPLTIDATRESLITLASEISEYFGVTYRALTSITRLGEVCIARQVYFKVAKQLYPNTSLNSIGRVVNRDHSTVIHGLRNIDLKIHINDAYENYCISRHLDFDKLNHIKCQ